jgi:adenosylmethionine-8-amino-7-oxononanoate aminotransferase
MKKASASQLDQWDKKYVWHPFTQMKEWNRGPIVVIERGEGNYLIDTRGRRYIDGVSSLWCNVHGHRVKKIDDAVKAQLGKIAHTTFLGLSNVPAIHLAKKLIAIVPKGLTRVFYSDSGSACVEAALKIAYQYWQNKGFRKKQKFLKLAHAYHGDTVGSVSVGGIDLFHEVYGPLLFKTFKAGSLAEMEKILKRHHKEIAAVVMEPLMQGAAGMLKQPKGNLARIRALTRKYKVLLIVDEVATGFGRTGKMFACEHERVTPDILCVAKGITGGYLPLSATIVTEEIYKAFLADYGKFKHFFHGHTYSANPLAAAAAVANLEIFEKEKTLAKLQPKIRLLTEELKKTAKFAHVGDIRQAGFMAGIELVKDRKTKAAYPLHEKRGFRVAEAARAKGVMIRPLGNVIVLMPTLSIKETELKKLCRVVNECIREITE